jgi:hypothetical protein
VSNREDFYRLQAIKSKLPEEAEHIYDFDDAYVDTRYWGRMKIKAIKFAYIEKRERKVYALDARDFIRVILKDALNGEIKFFSKNGNTI